jgi:hypothetical protein
MLVLTHSLLARQKPITKPSLFGILIGFEGKKPNEINGGYQKAFRSFTKFGFKTKIIRTPIIYITYLLSILSEGSEGYIIK